MTQTEYIDQFVKRMVACQTPGAERNDASVTDAREVFDKANAVYRFVSNMVERAGEKWRRYGMTPSHEDDIATVRAALSTIKDAWQFNPAYHAFNRLVATQDDVRNAALEEARQLAFDQTTRVPPAPETAHPVSAEADHG